MTSSGEQIRQDDCGERLIGTCFFKIILDETIRHKKLLIPGKFIQKYGQGLVNFAILKVPSGVKWVVSVVRDEIGVWFSDGWHEFVESHSLEHGHFLVFKYEEGSSSFSVVICDKTATEIAYPKKQQQPDEGGDKLFPLLKLQQCEEEEEAFDHRDDDDLAPVNKDKSPMEVSPPLKKMRGSVTHVNATRVQIGNCNFQIPQSPLQSLRGKGLVERERERVDNVMKLAFKDDKKEGGADDKRRMYDDQKPHAPMPEFSSQHPFFFIEITSKMLARKDLYVPVSFSTNHIGKDDKSVKLQVCDKTWSVALMRYSKYVYFTDDWNLFINENSLKPGDICIFESVQKMLLNVTIFRGCVLPDAC